MIPASQIEYNKPRVFPKNKNSEKKCARMMTVKKEGVKGLKKAHTTFISTCRQKTDERYFYLNAKGFFFIIIVVCECHDEYFFYYVCFAFFIQISGLGEIKIITGKY